MSTNLFSIIIGASLFVGMPILASTPEQTFKTEHKQVKEFLSQRPLLKDRLFVSKVIEHKILQVKKQLKNRKLRWMFENCFPNTLDTTVHFNGKKHGKYDTFVYTGDIHAMWLRDSAAQVWPYVRFAGSDEELRKMLAGVINRQMNCINIDPFANAFNEEATGSEWDTDNTEMKPELHERKWEIDSLCYPIRLAFYYWQITGDTSIFNEQWLKAMRNILDTFRDQQMKIKTDTYLFSRKTEKASDTRFKGGVGNPVKPVGLIASAFRPSDDATTFGFLIPSNFFAVTSLRKAATILKEVNHKDQLANDCLSLASEVEKALKKYAVYNHPKYGDIYAYEVDGFGNHFLTDDPNVPSLLAMPYLGDVPQNDKVYQNTRKFIWSADNPYFFKGEAGEGLGGPHVGMDMIWPMSIMMKAFTTDDDAEIKACLQQILNSDAGKGFIHESFNKDDANNYTRDWFAWQNTLFGELILKLIDEGKLDLLNSL